jgi:hypothetical protein
MKLRPQLFAILLLSSFLLIGRTAYSAITTAPYTTTINPLDTFVVPIKVQTTAGESIAAISGQLSYHSAQFYGPRVFLGAGITDWKSAGHVVRPGIFRFVIYKDPVGILPTNTATPTFSIQLTNAPYIIYGARAEFTFLNVTTSTDVDRQGKSSASNSLGQLFPNVSFGNITVNINQSSAENWLLYQ